jgi:hypothetical protein
VHVFILNSAEDTATYGRQDDRFTEYLSIAKVPKLTNWPAIELEEMFGDLKRVGRKADFHTTSYLAPLVSQRYIDRVGDQVARYGDFMPLTIKGRQQTFYRFVCHHVVDCLDVKRSQFRSVKQSFFKKRLSIQRPVVKQDKLGDDLMFRLPNTATETIFVTEQFRKLIIAHQLTGLKFMQDQYDFDGFET